MGLLPSVASAGRAEDLRTLSKEASRRYEFVREAEEFMWRHAGEKIELASVASALGCSIRKLLYSFKRTYGIGPIGYFKTQRLYAVREALQNDRTNRPILDIAADFGFWHMGHFGTDYKALFGVTPSQTRRAARPDAERCVV